MADRLHLVYDVLDAQVLDREGRKSGRVDGLVLHVEEGKPPRVAYIDIGTAVMLRRISNRLADWYEALRTRLIEDPAPPFHIPWAKVTKVGRTGVETDIDATRSKAFRLERWLRDHVIGPIPGSEHEHRRK